MEVLSDEDGKTQESSGKEGDPRHLSRNPQPCLALEIALHDSNLVPSLIRLHTQAIACLGQCYALVKHELTWRTS